MEILVPFSLISIGFCLTQPGLYLNKPNSMGNLSRNIFAIFTTRIMGGVAGDGEKGLGFEE
jgi:hypothetical protein